MLCTSNYHNVGIALLNHTSAKPNIVCSSSAGRHDRYIWPLKTILNGQVPRHHICDTTRNKKRRDFSGAAIQQDRVGLLNHFDATYARTDRDAHSRRIVVRYLGVFDSLYSSGDTKLNATVHSSGLFRRDEISHIKIFNSRTNLDCVVFGIKILVKAYPTRTLKSSTP